MAQRFTAWLGKPWSLGQAIAYGTLAVGGLDGLAAIVTFGLRGTTPYRLFQGIAVGLLGRASFEGGWSTSALGLVLHFVVALGIVTTFVVASRFLPALARRPLLVGPLYGVAAFFVMNLVVIPLSAIGTRRIALAGRDQRVADPRRARGPARRDRGREGERLAVARERRAARRRRAATQGAAARTFALAACAEAASRASRSRRTLSSLEVCGPGSGGTLLARRSSCGSASRAAGPRRPRPSTIRSRTARLVPFRWSAAASVGTAGRPSSSRSFAARAWTPACFERSWSASSDRSMAALVAAGGREKAWRISSTSAPARTASPV